MARAKSQLPRAWPEMRKEAFRLACARGDTIKELENEFGLTWETAKRYRRAELDITGQPLKGLGPGLWQFGFKLADPSASDYAAAAATGAAEAAFAAARQAFLASLSDDDLANLAQGVVDEGNGDVSEKDLQRSVFAALVDMWIEELGDEPTAEFRAALETARANWRAVEPGRKSALPGAREIDKLRKRAQRRRKAAES